MRNFHKLQRTTAIVLFFICLFFFQSLPVFSDPISDNTNSYSNLVNIHKRYFQLQEELFNKLDFKLSSDQVVKEGSTFKLILEDNLGRKWVFKEKGANRIIAQRLYALFGLDAPEIHNARLILNGKSASGTLQEFIPGAFTLSSYAPSNISASGLEYLMKAQVVDWLLRDHDPNYSNFLIFNSGKEGLAKKLMRIDQDCACLDPEASVLDYGRMVAIDRNLKSSADSNYYCRVEEAYRKKEIDLDLKRAYSFVRFIADFPESRLEEVIRDLTGPGENSRPGSETGALREKTGSWRDSLFLNKRKTSEGFRKLYLDLAAQRGAEADFPETLEAGENLKQAIANLENKLTAALKESSRISSGPSDRPVRISAIASLEGFRVIHRIYEVCWYKNGDLEKECGAALKTLRRLSSRAQPGERKAIDLYAQEIRKIQSGKGTTYQINQINKLIDPVFEPSKRKVK